MISVRYDSLESETNRGKDNGPYSALGSVLVIRFVTKLFFLKDGDLNLCVARPKYYMIN